MSDINRMWYDDRVKLPPPSSSHSSIFTRSVFESPKHIYNFFDNAVYGHTEAKRKLSMFLWNILNQNSTGKVLLMLGGTGTGKTELFRRLSQVYKNCTCYDCSSVTPQGYKGESKLYSALKMIDTKHEIPPLVVFDEFDKLIQSGNHGWDSFQLQSEMLKLCEDGNINIGTDNEPKFINTKNISFILMGAFTDLLHPVKSNSIGFTSSNTTEKKVITRTELKEFGFMPELLGRISDYCVLDSFECDDFYNILCDERYSPLCKLSKEYGISITANDEKCREIATRAFETGEGIRAMFNEITAHVNEQLFDDYQCMEITL